MKTPDISALTYVRTEGAADGELLSSGRSEWGFTSHGDNYIEGQITWGIVDGTLWVVDYKSGERIDRTKLMHQLATYALAVKKHLHWQGEVRMAAIFPFMEKTILQEMP